MSGLGVCQTVVELFSRSEAPASHLAHAVDNKKITQNQHDVIHVHHVMTANSGGHELAHSTSATPVPVQVDHHSSHLSCGFCILYGHAVPPPVLAPVWASALKRPYVTLVAFAQHPDSVVLTDYIKPQSRAPPIIFNI